MIFYLIYGVCYLNKFCITYYIDKNDNIVYLSNEWQLFAEQNRAAYLTEDTICYKSLFEFINDARCQYIYQVLINKVRKKQRKITFPFRCDSPCKKRYMQMEMIPLEGDSIAFKSCIIREELRQPVLIIDVNRSNSVDILKICSWCKKIQINNFWIEIEEAIEKYALFQTRLLPRLSHGVCSQCYDNTLKQVQ